MVRSFCLVLTLLSISASLAWADGFVTGYGQFPRIAGNPIMGSQPLYEWDLFLTSTQDGYVGPSRRLGAPPGQPPSGDGFYRIDGVPAGVQSVFVNQPDFFASPQVVPYVTIHDDRGTKLNVDLDVDYSTYFADSGEWTDWAWDYYQTFVASGTSVRGISWRHAGAGLYDGKTAVITLLEDNGNSNPTSWTPVGSGRDSRLSSDSDEWIRWNSAELPLTPGKAYAVHIHVDDGMAIYKRDKDVFSYADGRAFDKDGNPRDFDLNLTVFVDDGETLVTHTRKSSGPGVFVGSRYDTRWGQTFEATGTALAAVDLFAAGEPGFALDWTIRQSGPEGPQVGNSKTVGSAYFASTTGLAGVSFNPHEIPLSPGSSYYIEAYHPNGFTPYTQEAFNAYADGQAYRDGNAQVGLDLAMTIVEYDQPSAPRFPIAYTNFDEPSLGSDNFVAGAEDSELGFISSSMPSGGVGPFLGVISSNETATTPVLTHRSVAAVTTLESVDISRYRDVRVSLDVHVRNTGYESQDRLLVTISAQEETIRLLDVDGNSGLDQMGDEGFLSFVADLPDEWNEATLQISSFGNSSAGAEQYDFDNIRFTGYLPGDATGDGLVDERDFAIWQEYRFTEETDWRKGDFNGDGATDVADFNLWNHNRYWSPAATVPEPAGSFGLIGWTTILLLRETKERSENEADKDVC